MGASLDGPRGPAREVLQWRIILIPHFFSFLSISCRQQCRLSEQIWTRREDRENSTQAKKQAKKKERCSIDGRAARRIGGRLGLTDSSLRRAKRLSRPPMKHGDGDQSEWVTSILKGTLVAHGPCLRSPDVSGLFPGPTRLFFPGKGGKPRTKGQG